MVSQDGRPVVLVVDDTPESIDVLRNVLCGEYQIKAAITGAGGLRVAEQAKPDLILLDVMMPDLEGYGVCAQLKQNPATAAIPIIFVTTLAEVDNEARGLELGAVDYITKPFVPALVRSRVRTHLALRDQSRELEEKVRRRTAALVETRLEIIKRLGRAAEYRDNETGLHVIRMAHYAHLIALAAGMQEAVADLILHVAPMHDIGKIGVPDCVLLKPGALAPDEWAVMKRHTTIGAEIIGDHESELLSAAKTVALRHHERWDGSGYPDGLVGEQIPIAARVVAVADVFDALTSDRPYKRAWSIDHAVLAIRDDSGRQFDPALVTAFEAALPACVRVWEQYRDR